MGAPSWIFAGFEFSPDKGLRRQGRSIELSPKAQGLLELLLRAPGALVTKAAIAEALWPRGAASDESIARVGFVLRRTLEDAAGDLVKTVYGRGFRLQCEVQVVAASGVGEERDDARATLRRTVYEIAAGRTASSLRRAQEAMRHVVEKDPDNGDAWSLMADAEASLAIAGHIAPRTAAAGIAEFTSWALRQEPLNSGALAVSGWSLAVIEGRGDEGFRRLDEAIERAPSATLSRFFRAWARIGARDLPGALADIDGGLQVDSLDRALLNMRARTLLFSGRTEEADAFAAEAVRLRPDVDTFYYARVVTAVKRGEFDAAIAFAERAAEITGGERRSLALLAFALAAAGRRCDARATLRAASEGYPVSAFLAPAWVRLGEIDTARAVLREAKANGCPWCSFAWCSPSMSRL